MTCICVAKIYREHSHCEYMTRSFKHDTRKKHDYDVPPNSRGLLGKTTQSHKWANSSIYPF